MLNCPKCQIDYPEGKKFCRECGGLLMPKEDAPTSKKIIPEEVLGATVPIKKEAPAATLYCSSCNQEFPPGKNFCKTCGGPLSPKGSSASKAVSQSLLPDSVTPKPFTPVASIGREGGTKKYCPACGQEYLADKTFCKGCGVPLASQRPSGSKAEPHAGTGSINKEIQPSRPGPYPPGRSPSVANPSLGASDPGRTRRLLFESLMIANVVALLLLFSFGGFFVYKYFYKKENIFSLNNNLSAAVTPGAVTTAIPAAVPGPAPQGTPPQADEGVRRVFETIKQANLTKNIDLFMSCYSPAFPGYQEKRNSTLQTWQEYDMTKLDFTLNNLTVNQNRAEVTVNWQISAFSPGTSQTENFNSNHSVTLLNEGGQWKILNLR